MKANLKLGPSKAESLMSLLTESGVVYCVVQVNSIFWLLEACTYHQSATKAIDVTLVLVDDAPLFSPQDQATRLFNEITLFLSVSFDNSPRKGVLNDTSEQAMIPLFVILIVYNQHSITDTLHNGAHSGDIRPSTLEAGTHISFANRDPLGDSNVYRSNTVGDSTDTYRSNTNQVADPSVEKLHQSSWLVAALIGGMQIASSPKVPMW